jgi:hypothetical protein
MHRGQVTRFNRFPCEQGERFEIWAPSAVPRVPLGERWQVHADRINPPERAGP